MATWEFGFVEAGALVSVDIILERNVSMNDSERSSGVVGDGEFRGLRNSGLVVPESDESVSGLR